jgi:hypothetical protein
MLFIVFLILFVFGAGTFVTVGMKRKGTKNLGKYFSINRIADRIYIALKRFPVSVAIIVMCAVMLFIEISDIEYDISYRFWIFCTIAVFISISFILFFEDIVDYLKQQLITFFAVLLCGLYCFFLPEYELHTDKFIEIFIISATAFSTMFFISFTGKNKDHAFWNFATQTLFQMCLAGIFAAILFGGLSLALLAIETLFNISINTNWYLYLAVVCLVLFMPIYFLSNILNKQEKYDNCIYYSEIQKILTLYILVPILSVYALILYVYLFKIVLTWELPSGWVSYLVSALAIGGLAVITISYPVRQHEKNEVLNFIHRRLGLLILPLLILMTIGIFRRISDYGLTINRAYILLLNAWFYGIYIYMYFSNLRSIKWILISAVTIALIFSVNIWGLANITQRVLTKEIKTILHEQISIDSW